MINEDFIYKPTKAFWKIEKLISDGLKKYNDLEIETGEKQKRIFIIQGGAGASKTISILMLLIDSLNTNKQYHRITIASEELTKMRDTVVNDFQNIMIDWNKYDSKKWNDQKARYVLNTSKFVEFKGLDTKDVGKGRRREILYINEANRITLEKYDDISLRIGLSIIDYNPDTKFWAHDKINDFNFLNLTYLDNEYIPEKEKSNIENYKKEGFINPNLENYDVPENIKNNYYANKWRIYGLGQVAKLDNIIFNNWKKIYFSDYIKLNLPKAYGLDWGKTKGFAVVEGKYDEYTNSLYVHELNYKGEDAILSEMDNDLRTKINNINGGLFGYILNKIGVEKTKYVVCDSARPDNIITLKETGYLAYGIDKPKGSVMAGISLLHTTNVYYTYESKNIDFEYENYTYAKDRLGIIDEEVNKLNDHLMDAIRYLRRHFETFK